MHGNTLEILVYCYCAFAGVALPFALASRRKPSALSEEEQQAFVREWLQRPVAMPDGSTMRATVQWKVCEAEVNQPRIAPRITVAGRELTAS